jgi:N-acetylneuraminate synthase
VLYACTSGYPVPFSEVCLLEITRLRERFGHRVKAIGFSGHHLGIAVDAAATALGAAWVERHFTLDRTWKGTDHAASLEPDGLRRLVRDLRAVHRALRPKTTDLLGVEKPQRRKLKRLPGVHLPL